MKTYYLYKHMLDYLDNNIVELKFCRLGNLAGLSAGDKIFIDHRYDILSIFVHELLHTIYWDWTETKVLRKGNWFMRNSTWFQKKALMEAMLSLGE